MTNPNIPNRPGEEWMILTFQVEHRLMSVAQAIDELNMLALDVSTIVGEGRLDPRVEGLGIRNPLDILLYVPIGAAAAYSFQRLVTFAFGIPNLIHRNRREKDLRDIVMRAFKKNEWTPELHSAAYRLGIIDERFPIQGIQAQNQQIRREIETEIVIEQDLNVLEEQTDMTRRLDDDFGGGMA